MKVKAILLLIALCAGPSVAAEINPVAKKEIQHLFLYLEGSGCQFLRNGNWHSAQEASKHLQQKYKYMLNRGVISTAESFIERGASESSMSSKPYQVRCGNATKPDASAVWFKAELARYRAAAK
jgi:Family of unknown function (DUF5329)